MISNFALVPRFGSTSTGFDLGKIHGNISQYDAVSCVTATLADAMDAHLTSYTLVPNDNIKLDEKNRLPLLDPNTLVIVVGAGWSPKKYRERNFSSAVAFGPRNVKIAKLLLEAFNEWGKQCYFHHGCEKPKIEEDNPFIKDMGINCPIIEIRPFQINGPGVNEYWRRMQHLGEAFTVALSDIKSLNL